MKVFFDSNVLISVAISQGTCHKVFSHCLNRHLVCASPYVLNEVENKLLHKLEFTPEKVVRFITYLKAQCQIGKDTLHSEAVTRDIKDNPVIAAAIRAGAQVLVTGDKDLLVLKHHKTMKIVQPGVFKTIDATFEA